MDSLSPLESWNSDKLSQYLGDGTTGPGKEERLQSGRVIVTSRARLHVCLLDMNGELGRVDGSVGIAISEPSVSVAVSRGKPSESDRMVRTFVNRFYSRLRVSGYCAKAVRYYPQHAGLGLTTQLALCTGRGLSEIEGLRLQAREIARIMRRGGTSGIGTAVFERGPPLIVDTGHHMGPRGKTKFTSSDYSSQPPPAVLLRLRIPRNWKFVVALPKGLRGYGGRRELEFFRKKCPIPPRMAADTARIVLMRLLPAALEKDIDSFGSALNSIQKTGFKRYEIEEQSPKVRRLMERGLKLGAAGAGMSSMGPSVYFVLDSSKGARQLAAKLGDDIEETWVAGTYSGGARVSHQIAEE